jgi:hypothetical protein
MLVEFTLPYGRTITCEDTEVCKCKKYMKGTNQPTCMSCEKNTGPDYKTSQKKDAKK